jgi:hypothetical protein
MGRGDEGTWPVVREAGPVVKGAGPEAEACALASLWLFKSRSVPWRRWWSQSVTKTSILRVHSKRRREMPFEGPEALSAHDHSPLSSRAMSLSGPARKGASHLSGTFLECWLSDSGYFLLLQTHPSSRRKWSPTEQEFAAFRNKFKELEWNFLSRTWTLPSLPQGLESAVLAQATFSGCLSREKRSSLRWRDGALKVWVWTRGPSANGLWPQTHRWPTFSCGWLYFLHLQHVLVIILMDIHRWISMFTMRKMRQVPDLSKTQEKGLRTVSNILNQNNSWVYQYSPSTWMRVLIQEIWHLQVPSWEVEWVPHTWWTELGLHSHPGPRKITFLNLEMPQAIGVSLSFSLSICVCVCVCVCVCMHMYKYLHIY